MSVRPRRSVLYMPGSNARALDKARTLSADALILDLEDAVAPAQKVEARQQVLDTVQQSGYGKRELVVRVNGFDSEWGRDDINVFATAPIDAICLPKVETVTEIHAVTQLLKQAGADNKLKLWIMAETPRGILNIDAIADASSRLEVIVMGTSDLAKELRVPHTPDRYGLLTSLGLCVLAARAHGLDILDGVYLDLDDEAGYVQSCYHGRELGFDGKTLIHPSQLEAANRIFAPDDEQLARARKIIEAWETARKAGKGVVLVDGRLVESLHVEEALRQLSIAKAIEDSATG